MEPDRNVKKTVGFGVRRLALLSILTALCYVGRMMFQFIPNVQPVTAVLIILTLTLGMTDGFIVAILSIVLTNFLLGMGPWTIAQIASFGVLIVVTGLFVKPFYSTSQKRGRRILFCAVRLFRGTALRVRHLRHFREIDGHQQFLGLLHCRDPFRSPARPGECRVLSDTGADFGAIVGGATEKKVKKSHMECAHGAAFHMAFFYYAIFSSDFCPKKSITSSG